MAEVNLDNLLNGVQGKFWNYSNQNKDEYMTELTGTLVKISISQDHEFGHPETKKYWPDGNPVIMLRMHIMDPGGEEYLFDIKPKSSMWFEDIQPACPEGSLSNVLGQLIKLSYLGLVPVPGRSVNRNKFQLQILGPGQFESKGFDSTMPPTKAEARGMQPMQPQQPSPQQYTAQRMVQPQQQAQQLYGQQQVFNGPGGYTMDPRLMASMQAAQQAGSMSQEQIVQQQFPGAKVTTGYPGPMPAMPTAQNQQPAQDQQVPMDVYDADLPF